ncbi:hypothetical protein TNCV_570751 [Trichonephila clavipes]|nr:hypothetical protein TNCV_570751 [Trichonephila clavipes]
MATGSYMTPIYSRSQTFYFQLNNPEASEDPSCRAAEESLTSLGNGTRNGPPSQIEMYLGFEVDRHGLRGCFLINGLKESNQSQKGARTRSIPEQTSNPEGNDKKQRKKNKSPEREQHIGNIQQIASLPLLTRRHDRRIVRRIVPGANITHIRLHRC